MSIVLILPLLGLAQRLLSAMPMLASNTVSPANGLPCPNVANNTVTVTPADGLLCSDWRLAQHSSDCEYDPASVLGAEISGVSDFTTLTDNEIHQIRIALNKHKVVYFKGVAHLMTPQTQLSFAKRLGEVLPSVSNVPKYLEKGVHQSAKMQATSAAARNGAKPTTSTASATNTMVQANRAHTKKWRGESMPDGVTRVVREPGDPFAFGEGLHTDVTFLKRPPIYTFLAARELPGGKDDTHFVDAGRALRNLPGHLRAQLAGAAAVHNDSAGMHSVHPAVRTHPETGEQALYVNSHFTEAVLGYGDDDARGGQLLAEVFAHLRKQPVFRFKWQCVADPETGAGGGAAGDMGCDPRHVLLWDNRALQHAATSDWSHDEILNKRRREIHRIMMSDTNDRGVPFYRPSRSGNPTQIKTQVARP